MDIIDIMLAKALTPQGQIDTYARRSSTAVQQATAAVNTINSITDQTNANNELAEDTLAAANEALENAQETESRVESALQSLQNSNQNQIQDEIDNLAFQLSRANSNTLNTVGLHIDYPSGAFQNLNDITKLYKSTGSNEDGAMTQKAITDALALKADKTYVDQKIASASGTTVINQGGGISNLGSENSGKIVVVNTDGNIIAGKITEQEIIDALIKSGTYNAEGILGLTTDYENKNFTRTQEAASLSAGANFNKYSMFGGRMRCNVADDGTINAFYGDSGYTEDGSNGQVMIYQPKFYYKRTIMDGEVQDYGTVIKKENLMISPVVTSGFKLHPLFESGNDELEYVLTPVYEGSIYDVSENAYITDDSTYNIEEDKLSSIAGVKPLTGAGKTVTTANLATLAENRGTGWQLTNMQFESALQMLEIIEFGQLNGQIALEKGIVNITSSSTASEGAVTGSTASLGNDTGAAASTVFDSNGTRSTYLSAGQRAISYRGMENPWGSLWRVVSNCIIVGNGENRGGTPVIDGIHSLDFSIPTSATSTWISAMGYGNAEYDWVYMPIENSTNANSALPIGDNLWSANSFIGEKNTVIGGYYGAGNTGGPFNYGCDVNTASKIGRTNGRIMFVPTKNSIYEANIAKWMNHYGG